MTSYFPFPVTFMAFKKSFASWRPLVVWQIPAKSPFPALRGLWYLLASCSLPAALRGGSSPNNVPLMSDGSQWGRQPTVPAHLLSTFAAHGARGDSLDGQRWQVAGVGPPKLCSPMRLCCGFPWGVFAENGWLGLAPQLHWKQTWSQGLCVYKSLGGQGMVSEGPRVAPSQGPSVALGIPRTTNPGPGSPIPTLAAGPQRTSPPAGCRPPREAAAPLPARGQLREGQTASWAGGTPPDPPLCPGPGAEHPPPRAEARGFPRRRGHTKRRAAAPFPPPVRRQPPLPPPRRWVRGWPGGAGQPRGADDGAAASGAAAAPSVSHGHHHQQLLHRQPVGQLQHPRLRQGVPADTARAPHGDRDRE